MLKYTDVQVTFREIPDEITLCINISGCPIRCPDCHSKELWEDLGTELSPDEIKRLISQNKGISCVCFMGGDGDFDYIQYLGNFVKNTYSLKTAWYSGRPNLDEFFTDCVSANIPIQKFVDSFDYTKFGPYRKELGGLDNPNTNQRLYKIYPPNFPIDYKDYFRDITNKFWNEK